MNEKKLMAALLQENALEPLRSNQPFHLIEKMREASQDAAILEGPIVKCVLITEGLGNRHDLNYYGADAILNGAGLFEGKPCFLDHMGESEGADRPERTVKDKCGYFKNVHTESVNGLLGLVAELHFDLSESGQMAYAKALTAIHYKGEFPNSDSEYVGLSINANGRREKRTMQIGDEALEVNYVTEFTDVGSIDEVTTPARGGRFLAALVESAAGAILQRKETRTMIVKSLKAALSALTEALKDKEIAEPTKVKLTESQTSLDAILKEAMKCAKGKEADTEESTEESAEESDTEESARESKRKESKKKADTADDDEKGDDDDAQESKRGYIKAMLKESGLPKKVWNVERLMGLALKEAKADIAEKKALLESLRESKGSDEEIVPTGAAGDALEESSGEKGNLNSMFVACSE